MINCEFFTVSGIRLRRYIQRLGNISWLLIPGGPGIGSESLFELADALDVPGNVWLIDLPGDGSNIDASVNDKEYFSKWPNVILEAARAIPNSILVGHSTGGMYLLSEPELEKYIVGLVLISTAPNSNWRSYFFEMTKKNQLPEVDLATKEYEKNKSNERLRDIAIASAEWNFTPKNIEIGRKFLARMPYNYKAVEWSSDFFDEIYTYKWWPKTLPTLILSGAEDRIVFQKLWDQPQFQKDNIVIKTIEDAGHFLWIENPESVRAAFKEWYIKFYANLDT